MRYLLLAITMFLSFTISKVNAQNINTDVIGKWKVIGMKVDPEGLSKDDVRKAEMFRSSFLKSTLVFMPDKNFSFDIDIKEIEVKNGHWKYDPKSKTYIIQEWKDKDRERSVLMEIKVDQISGKIFFLIPETPFILEVQKEA